MWDVNEQQRGPAGILTLLAGGRASAELQAILASEGHVGAIAWEDDPWSRGGYAYVDPQFDPRLRPWLARPAGRVMFAGEHTSVRWQGYLNGAIESGKRAAAEVRATRG